MRKSYYWIVGGSLVLVAMAAYPVYAHCNKCVESAQEFWNAMNTGKVTLTQAITAAQSAGKGNPIKAVPFKHKDGQIHVHVYLLDNDKLSVAMIDTKTGQLVKTVDAKDLEDHKHDHEHGEKPGERKP